MLPEVGASRPVSILMVVDLPAPLGPRKPKNWPASTRRFTSCTAVKSPNRRVRSVVSMAGVVMRPYDLRSRYTLQALLCWPLSKLGPRENRLAESCGSTSIVFQQLLFMHRRSAFRYLNSGTLANLPNLQKRSCPWLSLSRNLVSPRKLLRNRENLPTTI